LTTPSLHILRELCSTPTAPFLESRVVAYVRQFVARRKKLRLHRDSTGNLLIELPGRKNTLPRWVFCAHMDHPGMVTRRMLDPHTVEAEFRGWVLPEFPKGEKVRFFDGDREITGVVTHVEPDTESHRTAAVRARVAAPLPPDCIGMWDQGPGRIKGRKFLCRACDDLAGAAAALAMLDQLHRNPPAAPVAVLLTRAEEDGFVGAIAAARRPNLLRKTDRIIAIETSALQPYAPQEKGPIIRLGDKTSIFNSSLSYFLTQQAEAIAKTDKSFLFQRNVMPGGTCEATVYDVFGFHAASICVALGNYHNMDRQKQRIAPEFIDVPDWLGMVRLFLALARNGHSYSPGHKMLRKRLLKRFDDRKHLL
jgi:putative aminopeptidase FrvX